MKFLTSLRVPAGAVLWVAISFLTVGGSGCGLQSRPAETGGGQPADVVAPAALPLPPAPAAPPAQRPVTDPFQIQKDPADALSLEVRHAAQDVAFPSTEGKDGLALETMASGADLEIQNVLWLGEGPLFFVWPENALGALITQAYFEQRVEGVTNVTQGSVERTAVEFDAKTRRWFIPFSQLFKGREFDLVSDETHLLTLVLFQSGSPQILIHVRFRVQGTLPKIEVTEGTPSESASDPLAFVQEIAHHGRVIESHTMKNPSLRPMKLWLRPGTDTYRLSSFVEVAKYNELSDSSPASLSAWDRYVGSVELAVRQVKIVSKSRSTETRNLDPGAWTEVVLQPNETLELQWLAASGADAVHCELSRAPVLHSWVSTGAPYLTVVDRPEMYLGQIVVPALTHQEPTRYSHVENVDQSWHLFGASLEGEGLLEVRATQFEATADQVEARSPRSTGFLGVQDVFTGIALVKASAGDDSIRGLGPAYQGCVF